MSVSESRAAHKSFMNFMGVTGASDFFFCI
jgi:hypothetical protein